MTPRAPAGTRLAALVVNYNTGAFAEGCVRSIERSWAAAGRAPADLEIVVLDNASPLDQSAALARIEALGATVVRNPTNDGYARGMNLAFEHTSGGPRDVVAILNPDLFFPPDALERLLGYVATHDDVGAVDPRAFMDPAFEVCLPRNVLPTPAEWVRVLLARLSPSYCRAYGRRRLGENLEWWLGEAPIETTMLSGCCVFLRREVVARMPSLMNERYPLYFEDTDLFRTVESLGYRVVHLSDARLLHYWSRSVGASWDRESDAMKRYRVSQSFYFRKFYGRAGSAWVRALDALSLALPKRLLDRPAHRCEPLGVFADPVTIPMPRPGRYVLELTVSPTFLLTAGILVEGDAWRCPAATWEWFFAGRYWFRAYDLETRELAGAWTFDKCTPGRFAPVAADELVGAGKGAGEGAA